MYQWGFLGVFMMLLHGRRQHFTRDMGSISPLVNGYGQIPHIHYRNGLYLLINRM